MRAVFFPIENDMNYANKMRLIFFVDHYVLVLIWLWNENRYEMMKREALYPSLDINIWTVSTFTDVFVFFKKKKSFDILYWNCCTHTLTETPAKHASPSRSHTRARTRTLKATLRITCNTTLKHGLWASVFGSIVTEISKWTAKKKNSSPAVRLQKNSLVLFCSSGENIIYDKTWRTLFVSASLSL